MSKFGNGLLRRNTETYTYTYDSKKTLSTAETWQFGAIAWIGVIWIMMSLVYSYKLLTQCYGYGDRIISCLLS